MRTPAGLYDQLDAKGRAWYATLSHAKAAQEESKQWRRIVRQASRVGGDELLEAVAAIYLRAERRGEHPNKAVVEGVQGSRHKRHQLRAPSPAGRDYYGRPHRAAPGRGELRRGVRRMEDIFEERGIPPEVWKERPYERWEADDRPPWSARMNLWCEDGLQFALRIAKQSSGWLIHRFPPPGLELDHIYPEFRPDEPVKTRGPQKHWHGSHMPDGSQPIEGGS